MRKLFILFAMASLFAACQPNDLDLITRGDSVVPAGDGDIIEAPASGNCSYTGPAGAAANTLIQQELIDYANCALKERDICGGYIAGEQVVLVDDYPVTIQARTQAELEAWAINLKNAGISLRPGRNWLIRGYEWVPNPNFLRMDFKVIYLRGGCPNEGDGQ
ncbi:MAG: hypothetical protein AAFQ98_25490 [Bacteroidota bacterium]